MALCGIMWHYTKIHKKTTKHEKNMFFLLWHYVALCGTIKKHRKWQKNNCGTMWHYVALSKKMEKTPKTQKHKKTTQNHTNKTTKKTWHFEFCSYLKLFVQCGMKHSNEETQIPIVLYYIATVWLSMQCLFCHSSQIWICDRIRDKLNWTWFEFQTELGPHTPASTRNLPR